MEEVVSTMCLYVCVCVHTSKTFRIETFHLVADGGVIHLRS